MKHMTRGLIAIAFFLFMMLVAPSLVGEKGYVLIAMGQWTIEFSVVSLVFMFIAALAAITLLLQSYRFGLSSALKLGEAIRGRHLKNKEKRFYEGLFALAEGDHEAAKKQLSDIKTDRYRSLNDIALLYIALNADDVKDAENRYQEIVKQNDSRAIAVGTKLMAQYQISKGDSSSGLSLLENVDTKNTQMVSLKAQALLNKGDHKSLQSQLPKWKKALGNQYIAVKQQLAAKQFADIASKEGANQLNNHWQTLPKVQRNDEQMRITYLQQLIAQNMHQQAHDHLADWYSKTNVPDTMLEIIKTLRVSSPVALIKILERTIKKQPDDPRYYASLGHLAYHADDINLSEKALAKAVTLRETKPEMLLLANIYEQQMAYPQAIEALHRANRITE